MDPRACLRMVFSSITEGNFQEARASLLELMVRIAAGGPTPDFPFPGEDPALSPSEYNGVCFTLCHVIDLGVEAAKKGAANEQELEG